MGQLPHWLLWYTAVLGSTVNMQRSEDSHLPEITNQEFISQCVDAHNTYRSKVKPTASNMFYMTWDEALAISARAWARHCKFIHNPRLETPRELHPTFHSVGENIWVGTAPSTFTVDAAMELWYNEEVHYDYRSNICHDVCGHYTQVVWARSYKVGCAVQACRNGVEFFTNHPGAIFVCNYGDAGNYAGFRPYKMGQSCKECSNGTCQNNLCSDAKRDQLKRYDWSPHWDPEASSSPSYGSYCVAVWLARPISIPLIFIGVYGLQILYQNMFTDE